MKNKLKNIKIKKEVLQKLIEYSGYEYSEIAQKMKIDLAVFNEIIEGKRGLTVSQLKRLARILRRPLAAFFSDEIRSLPDIPDYR